MDPVHLSIVVIGFLMVVNWTRGIRPFLVWGLSFWVTAVYAVSTHSGFVRSGWPNLQLVSGEYGSSQMIVLSYALFVAVFAFYVFDKWRARAVGGALIGAELPR